MQSWFHASAHCCIRTAQTHPPTTLWTGHSRHQKASKLFFCLSSPRIQRSTRQKRPCNRHPFDVPLDCDKVNAVMVSRQSSLLYQDCTDTPADDPSGPVILASKAHSSFSASPTRGIRRSARRKKSATVDVPPDCDKVSAVMVPHQRSLLHQDSTGTLADDLSGPVILAITKAQSPSSD